MSYATIDDLRDFLPRYKIDDTTQPSAVQATGYLSLTSTVLDGILAANGYDVPMTAPESLILLKNINLTGAGYYATRVMFPGSTNGIVMQLQSEWMMYLEMLGKGTIALPDATSGQNVAQSADIDVLDPFRFIDDSQYNDSWSFGSGGNAPFVRRNADY